jgi:hypothetical protein
VTLLPYLFFSSVFSTQRFIEQYSLSPERELLRQEHKLTILGENQALPEGTLAFLEQNPLEEAITLNITPKEFYKQPLIIQGQTISELFGRKYAGLYNKYSNAVHLDTLTLDKIIHEFSHAKGFAAEKNNDLVLEEWADISGKEEYITIGENIFGYLVEQKKDTTYLEKGFVSLYAKTNVHEDYAELIEDLEIKVHKKEWSEIIELYENPCFTQKIDLLMETKGFNEDNLLYANLANGFSWIRNEAQPPNSTGALQQRERIIEAFQKANPESSYLYELQRVNFLNHTSAMGGGRGVVRMEWHTQEAVAYKC